MKYPVAELISAQFPQWRDLPIVPVAESGWDNRSFRLGEEMVVRMPSRAAYAPQVEKEQRWLPRLAPSLPLEIPEPLAMGQPGSGYPWHWSIYRWIEGEPAKTLSYEDVSALSEFLTALHGIETSGAPRSGEATFHRGGDLAIYDKEARRAFAELGIEGAEEIWEEALSSKWAGAPLWVHGDVSRGNLLKKGDRLTAVIDFGLLCVGDPASDLAIAWSALDAEGRAHFRDQLPLDSSTWNRGRGWALWKAAIVAAGLTETNQLESERCRHVLLEILSE